jgi:hypothetical protein
MAQSVRLFEVAPGGFEFFQRGKGFPSRQIRIGRIRRP